MGIYRPKVSTDQLFLDDRYELLSIIGRGGNSLVYSARPTDEVRAELNLPETVALKLFSDASASPEIIERIQREAMCLRAIDHPRVIKIYDYSTSMDLSYIVLESAPGGDVKGILERDGRLDSKSALRFGIQLLDALTVIHQAEILHRDVKPENLLIAEDGTLRLSDFGVSRFAYEQEAESQDNIVRGTLGYIAPEQLVGQTETAATDLFGAAVTIFEMLTGKLPFEGESLTSMLDAMLGNRQLAVSNILGRQFWALDNVLAKGLASDPVDRFQSALDFRRALEEVIWGLEQEARIERQRVEVRLSAPMSPVKPQNESDVIPALAGRRKPSLKLIAGAAFMIILGCVLIGRDNATAHLRREAPRMADTGSSWFGNLFSSSSEGAYEQAKLLAEAPRVGVLYNFLGDGENVFFSTTPALNDAKDAFLLSVAIPGWKPQLVSLSPTAKSREVVVSAGGLQFELEISRQNLEAGAVVSGQFKDLASGRQSRWAAF